jgi:NAD(P)H-dependent flavin oxidoreductase YrpB (nitropropane dioxygenase family)
MTRLCRLLGIGVPIVQAPIGNASCPELVAAVSEAGALGMLSVTWRKLPEVRRVIREVRDRTARPFGVNLVLEWEQDERLDACLEEGARIVSFFWGDPARYIDRVHQAGGIVMHTVGSAAEARQRVGDGVDVVVAQGIESGGHVWGQVSTMALVPAVVDAVDPVPVVAAGGVADARGMAAAMALGASGVWMGTRFVATLESAAHPAYKRAVLEAVETDAVYTRVFDRGWPRAPHRVLRNSTIARSESTVSGGAAGRPGEGEVIARFADGTPVIRYGADEPLAGMEGEVEAMALYAGQSAALVHDLPSAAGLVPDLMDQSRQALSSALSRLPGGPAPASADT